MDYNLIQYISEFADFETCIEIISLCRWTANNLKIKYVNINDYTLQCRLDDSILQQNQYSKMIELNMRYNSKITKISHLNKLEKLCIGTNCKITNNECGLLNLFEFDISYNIFITKISHMKNLKKLCIIGSHCGIIDDEIQGLNPCALHVDYNPKITKISHMKDLQ